MPDEASSRGWLVAIGGGEARTGDDLPILERFVARCGGTAARLVMLSAAAADPTQKTGEYREAFASLGIGEVEVFHQKHRREADDPALLAAVEAADGVYLMGGGQLRLVTMIGGTALEALLHERYRAGLHLAGTSAGASAMSAVMIARGKARSAARLSSVRMSPGFGFLPGVIIDQHFRERDRFGRLLAAVLSNPGMLGFGLDEDTAFELDPCGRASVFGSGTLTIVDASELEQTDVYRVPEEAPAAFAGMRLHVLSEGWSFALKERRVEAPHESHVASDRNAVPLRQLGTESDRR